MTIEQLTLVSEILLVLAVIFAGLSVFLYFKYNINRAWHLLTGKRIKDNKVKTAEKKSKDDKKVVTDNMNDVPITDRLLEQVKKSSGTLNNNYGTSLLGAGSIADGQATTLLGESDSQATTLLGGNDSTATTLLGSNEGPATTVLGQTEEMPGTTVLSEEYLQKNAQIPFSERLIIRKSITFIHTDIRLN